MKTDNNLLMNVDLFLRQKGVTEIRKFDVQSTNLPFSYMLVAYALSDRHVRALADALRKELKDTISVLPNINSSSSSWSVIDVSDVLIHIMDDTAKEFYNAEELWNRMAKGDINDS